MNEHYKLLNKHLTAENKHDMADTLATLHPECEFCEVPFQRTYTGLDGARQHYEFWWSTFDLVFDETIQTHWTQDGRFIAEAVFKGRHIGEFLGIKPTNNIVRYPFLVIVEFRDGLLFSEKFYFDTETIRNQLV